ncbi:MAG: DUF4410 domain-containing protein [Deltaproteobacteria bacterium]|jgi:hypothetical protein|nr:DUF4410 domain-containing protein [Deltaproteobacteria bacterium]
MKKLFPVLFLFCLFFVFGCSMKTNYIPTSGAPEVALDSNFAVGEITDNSGFKFPENEKEVIDLKQAMREALQTALREKGALREGVAPGEQPVTGDGSSPGQGTASGEGTPPLGEAIAAPYTPYWTVNVDIVKYEPGNAFSRWLMPGAGTTRLSVVANITNQTGLNAARIASERSIGFGGAYTIGAWKYVFDEVAKEIVQTLIDPKRRNPTPGQTR